MWEPGGPSYELTVDPDGGAYSCDFTPEWDLQPGDSLGFEYIGSDGNTVYNAFYEPVADLQVDKDGRGQPAPGSNYLYRIYYRNQGDALAHGVVLSDALPAGMTYLDDTSGLPHSIVGNTVVCLRLMESMC